MSEVEMVLGALAAGASTVASRPSARETAVQTAYLALKNQLRFIFADRPDVQYKLNGNHTHADGWRASIGTDLTVSGAVKDPKVLRAAAIIQDHMFQSLGNSGPNVQLSDCNGVIVGDYSHQENRFG